MDSKLPKLNRRDCLKTLSLAAFAGTAAGVLSGCRRDGLGVPEWVTYPEEEWVKIDPADAGLDAGRMDRIFAAAEIHPGGFGGTAPGDDEWGAVLTRGGYLVYSFGDPTYKTQSASLGKCLVRALLGLAVDDGLVDPDEPIWKTWTGRMSCRIPTRSWIKGITKPSLGGNWSTTGEDSSWRAVTTAEQAGRAGPGGRGALDPRHNSGLGEMDGRPDP